MTIRDIQERRSQLSSVQEVDASARPRAVCPVPKYPVVTLRARTRGGGECGGHSEAAGAALPLFLSDKRPALDAAPNACVEVLEVDVLLRFWLLSLLPAAPGSYTRAADDDAQLPTQRPSLLLAAPGSYTRAAVDEMRRFLTPRDSSDERVGLGRLSCLWRSSVRAWCGES